MTLRRICLRVFQLGLLSLLIALAFFSYEQFSANNALENDLGLVKAEVLELKKDKTLLGSKLEVMEQELNRKSVYYAQLQRERESKKSNKVYILAVMGGEGVPITMESEVRSGEGRLFFESGDVLYSIDMQTSLITALDVSKRISGTDLKGKDLIVRINNPYEYTLAVQGPSAGSAMAVLLTANLMNRDIRDGVLITGAIGEDGSISRVGDVNIKTEAARKVNADVLLAPSGQSLEAEGIRVVEVSNIEEALLYMLGP